MSHSPVPGSRAVGYCRVSQPGQSTIPEQRAWIERVAREKGWQLVEVITDEGWSGDDASRPGLARLERLLVEHQAAGVPIDRITVWHTDRLSRSDTLDAFETLARLRRAGLRYLTTH